MVKLWLHIVASSWRGKQIGTIYGMKSREHVISCCSSFVNATANDCQGN